MLKVGIIGTGGISSAHILGYLEFPGECEIVALADPTPEKAARKAEEFGLTDAAVFTDGAELIASGAVDLISIATPPSSHAPLTIAALDAGIHVIVEKPMAPSLDECDAMIAAQRRSGAVLSVIAQNRFRDDLSLLNDVVRSGLLGSISFLRVDSAWWRGLAYYDLWWRGTWDSEGGGCTLNHAIHHIDLLLWLMGRPEQVVSMLANAQHDNAEVEDLSVAIFRYGRGLAQLTASTVHHGEHQEIVVQGARARVSQPWSVAAERSQPNGFPAEGSDPDVVAALNALAEKHVPLAYTGHAGQIRDVLTAIETGRAPSITGEDGRNAVEVVTAIYKAGIERELVDLPLRPDDPYGRAGGLTARAPHFYEKRESVREQAGEIVVGASSDSTT